MSFLDIVKLVIVTALLVIALVKTAKDDLERHDMDIHKIIDEDKDIDDDN